MGGTALWGLLCKTLCPPPPYFAGAGSSQLSGGHKAADTALTAQGRDLLAGICAPWGRVGADRRRPDHGTVQAAPLGSDLLPCRCLGLASLAAPQLVPSCVTVKMPT